MRPHGAPPDYDPAEPTSAMRPILIAENGERLVDFTQPPYNLVLDRPRFLYERQIFARERLARRLAEAHAALKRDGYGLLVLECWRPPFIQRRMFRAVEAKFRETLPDLPEDEFRKVVERYSAPMDDEAPPPHTTGGAVDLWLSDATGGPADLHAPFDFQDDAGFAFGAQGLGSIARANRDRLAEALRAVGLTNYPSEYWHFSYGDQGWAYRGGHPRAVYGATEPPGWSPNPADDVDAPLEFVVEADPQSG